MKVRWVIAVALCLATLTGAAAGGRDLKLGTTTTTENSGLMADLIPRFEKVAGIRVRLIVRGTGDVLAAARRGDLDAVLTHDPEGEEKFVAEGFGLDRRPVMENDFILVGPKDDPAGIRGLKDAVAGLARVAKTKSTLVSRGDESGTHRAETRLWTAAGIDPAPGSGTWYLESGSGMGTTLNIAAAKDAYTLVDRGTWRAFGNRRGLVVLVEGDARLANRYSVMRVNPDRHKHVNVEGAKRFLDWLTGPPGQSAISAFRIDGEIAFRPTTK